MRPERIDPSMPEGYRYPPNYPLLLCPHCAKDGFDVSTEVAYGGRGECVQCGSRVEWRKVVPRVALVALSEVEPLDVRYEGR